MHQTKSGGRLIIAESVSRDLARWHSEDVGTVFSTASEGHHTVKINSTANLGTRLDPQGANMGSRANLIVVDRGRYSMYYSHWGAQDLPSDLFWGPDHAIAHIRVALAKQ